ncbi:N-6 DNA methylase [Sphingomonas kaistensis]|uniref:N-6 DNA methylase n=1 Tax=Sphingomonas kaistensis TaxID=298708 RepID=A0ABZ2FYN6_9SPHN
MIRPFSAQIAHLAWRHGLSGDEAVLLAAGLGLASSIGVTFQQAGSTRGLLAEVAGSLRPRDDADGLASAREWLRHPSAPYELFDSLDGSVEALLESTAGPMDWDAELDALLEAASYRGPVIGMPVAIAAAMLDVLALPAAGNCACTFGPTATIAWALSERRHVKFYAGDPDTARLFSMFAAASGRDLLVDRRNPLDGSFAPVQSEVASRDRPPLEEVDHLISVSPFGQRVRNIDETVVSIEALQVQRLRRFARKTFLTIVPDGFLFRDSRSEADVRRDLVETAAVEVESLPAGVFGRSQGISTSLVRVRESKGGKPVRFLDGRNMRSQTTGKIQERLLIQHLQDWPQMRDHEDRSAMVPTDTIAANNFVLMPDRYVRPKALQTIQDAVAELPQVALTDVATIERGKAPRPTHEAEGEPALVCLELAPGDIQGGFVGKPRRTVAFSADEAQRARNVGVRPGDILVSIKGNVGICGMVPEAAPSPEDEEPWIISQSLAIIRYRPNPHIPSPEILNAVLTAPWVRRGLERLAGGSTVRTLSMNDLRKMEIPVLPAAQLAAVGKVLDQVTQEREEVAERLASIGSYQRRIWAKLWGMNPDKQDHSLYA